jgi:hypothetical protein
MHGIEAVKTFVAQGNGIKTRVRELPQGDRHDRPVPWMIPGVTLSPEAIVSALETLEKQGFVIRTETVHPFDSTEYLIQWYFVWEKQVGEGVSCV